MLNSSPSTFFAQAARRIVMAGAAGVLALTLGACGAQSSGDAANTTQAVDQTQATEQVVATADDVTAVLEGAAEFSIDTSSLFSDRDVDASYDASKAVQIKLDELSTAPTDGVSVDGSTVTITSEGTYIVSGSLADGRLVVDAPDTAKVQLVLDDASISSSTGTALYVRSADKVFVTLAKDTTNTLTSTGASTEEDEHTLDGTLFASDDLTINGEGTLVVTSEAGHGIVGKDEVTLVSGTVQVTAAEHAIQAKDSLAAKDGTYTLKAGSDGVHVEHDSNGEKGFAYVAGGTWNIEAGSDGFDTSNDLRVDGGSISVAAVDDGLHSEYDLIINDGTIRVSQSYEGLEGARIEINGGDVDVVASDDGVNAAGNPDGTSADDAPAFGERGQGQGWPSMQDGQQPQDGQMPEPPQDGERPQPPEGQEGQMPEPPQDGEMPQQGVDGGRQGARMNMGAGDGAHNMRMGGGGPFERDDTASITITGGKLQVNADGDGLDSNGDLLMSGGEVYVSGPTSDGDGAVDTGGDATITGGTFVAVGSAGMAQSFGEASTQGSVASNVTGNAGDLVEVKDASGNVLVSFTPVKGFAHVVASAPGMTTGSTYTVTVGSQSYDVTV